MTQEEINEIRTEIREAIHQSSEMDSPVVDFVTGDQLTDRVCELACNGDLVGIYYNENGELTALDVWAEEHQAERKE